MTTTDRIVEIIRRRGGGIVASQQAALEIVEIIRRRGGGIVASQQAALEIVEMLEADACPECIRRMGSGHNGECHRCLGIEAGKEIAAKIASELTAPE